MAIRRLLLHMRFRLSDAGWSTLPGRPQGGAAQHGCSSRSRCTRAASRRLGCCRAPSTTRSQPPGHGWTPGRAGSSTASVKASRARSRKACGPLACVRHATAAWPRLACKPWPQPSTSTTRSLVRRTPARTHPHLALCRVRGLAHDFANGIRSSSLHTRPPANRDAGLVYLDDHALARMISCPSQGLCVRSSTACIRGLSQAQPICVENRP